MYKLACKAVCKLKLMPHFQKRTIAILKPCPKSPNKFSLGIRQSSNMRLHVDEARIPNLLSFAPRERPAVGIGTMNALIPYNSIVLKRSSTAAPY